MVGFLPVQEKRMPELGGDVINTIKCFQRNEITEYHVYKALAGRCKDRSNSETLMRIAEEELRHYKIWHKYSQVKVKPDFFKRWFYVAVSLVFGITFGIKLMESGESNAQIAYDKVKTVVPEAEQIHDEEHEHENRLTEMIDEEKLKYMGSVVLGLNDALVELTGALAGFTFALRNTNLIAVVGLITGLSASASMAASEYLSTKTEAEGKSPLKASLYTGMAYVLTVVMLITPFFVFQGYITCLFFSLLAAAFLIMAFTFYFSVVKEIRFINRFIEMFTISMGVALISFLIGVAVRRFLHVDV